MPGTPVIYYGDEIGMGDNIHLGDRDGVRTPMQWSFDRNGGFSRVDPARLVLPAIMDPLYGFQGLNVEAQEADAHSLLAWTRRMLAVRRGFAAFGRGTLKFLYPGNRKVFAYLREMPGDEGETVLCVCNLSRTAQAVELDLSTFNGRVPVDIVGGSVFPPIGQLTYLLTLAPYGFFWFQLATAAALPSWHTQAPEALPELATIVIRGGIAEVLQAQGRQIILDEVLPAYMPMRRWFASKTEKLKRIEIAYAVPLPGVDDVLLCEITTHVGDGADNYVLPLAISWEDETAGPLTQQLALARVRRGRRVGTLTDGFAVDGFTTGVMAQLRAGGKLAIADGELEFKPSPLLASIDVAEGAEIRRLSAEQSNSSLILGDAVVLKIVRRVVAGINPEIEMTRYLTERGFGNTAALYGEVVRTSADGTPRTLMLAQAFVRNQGDGWGWTLDFLARAVEEIAVTHGESEDEEDVFAEYGGFAVAVGKRLGELHAVLSQPSDQPEFAPEQADDATLRRWADSASEQLDMAFGLLREMKSWPDEATREMADSLLAREQALHDAAWRLARQGGGALQTRVHGDFHLGQVLVVQGDAFIIDFEGEPARPMQQRRAKSCPLRDVAGLLRSFDYAAASGAGGRTATSAQTDERRAALLERFRDEAARVFLHAYREVLNTAERRWVPEQAEAPLLDLLLMEKAAYEIRYEAANRPTWLAIPLRGLAEIADRILVAEPVA